MVMKLLPSLALAVAFSLSAAFPALAQDRIDDIVGIEVLDGGQTGAGRHLGAIRLTLEDGWKTYWRAPGEAGIPPAFDWSGSRNVGEVRITWPTPDVIDQNGLETYGYSRQLILPVEVTPRRAGEPVRLKGRMDFGVCKDVCVPASLRFDGRLDADSPRHPAIAAALAQRPYSAREAGVRSAVCQVRPTRDGLRLTARIAMPSAGGREVAVIEPGARGLWSAGTKTRRQGPVLEATSELIAETAGGLALDRSKIRITVLGRNHAVDIQGCTAG